MIMIALPQTLTPFKTKFCRFKEWTMKLKKEKLKEWTQKMKEWTHKMKEWTMNPHILIKKDIAYVILPLSTTIMEDPIGAPLNGKT